MSEPIADEPLSLPVVHLRAAIAMLWPEEITPHAKRLLERICDECEEQARSWGVSGGAVQGGHGSLPDASGSGSPKDA